MELHDRVSFFDRPLADLLRPDWERIIYAGILLLAILSRFWDVGARAISFDECTHALYSYRLYSGQGFTHDPMMHGPFLFHANALAYFLFGDSDYTSRIVPALFGVFLVMSPLLLRRWLGRWGAIIASILLLLSPSILYYSRYLRNEIYVAVWMVLLTAALFHFIEERKPGWLYLGAAVLMLSLATKENAYFFGYMGFVFIIEVVLWERPSRWNQAWLYLGCAVLSLVLLFVAAWLGRAPAEGTETGEAASGIAGLMQAVITVVGGTIPAVMISASLLRSRHPRPSSIEEALRCLSWRNWLMAGIVMFILYALLFTAFFTSPSGLVTGIFGSLSYWLAQQEVQRGGQPWYYYSLLLLMYEFVPLLFGLAGVVYYLVRRPSEHSSEPSASTVRCELRFIAFLVFWTLTSLFMYAWAGEKMPWMVVHQAVPLIFLAAKFAGDVLRKMDWLSVWRRGGAWLALLLPITLLAFGGWSQLQVLGNKLSALPVLLLLVILMLLIVRRLGARDSLRVAFVTLLALLSFFTIRFAWMAAYINYDYATEPLVYAHGGADVELTMDEIAEISQRTVGDKTIEVAYDQEAAWPIEWYLRKYPNRVFYGTKPSRQLRSLPIVIASDDIDARVRPLLGDRFHRFERRELWWPNQQYMGLTWERIYDILASPEKREILWKILYYREYPRTPDDWYHVGNMYLYIRKDLAYQPWDYGDAPPQAAELLDEPYAEARIELGTERAWGVLGTEAGQFNHPRGIAVGPKGNVYVVDSDNHRIQVFDRHGAFQREWGSQCDLATGHGCVDSEGNGQFQEPWGIAVADDGRVYVADTWNHRVQVFDADGVFLTQWGAFGQTAGVEGGPYTLYGPRDVAVDDRGRVFVTDTGNKRVLVYDQDGNYLAQWGGAGSAPGKFEEPVGIAVDAAGNIFVADTWNLRVQVFGHDLAFLREWPVEAWYGDSVVNKPYIAVDGEDRVYLTDPEGYLVLAFSAEGDLLATFGEGVFSLPTGIDVDDDGYLYVTDTNGQNVMRFEPLP